ncbi:class I SAM-dependent methyltransferase [uncultured Tyzzerella sp.]|uniref:tRNA (adenine(22)-N(1))-methyltransferase n=1 Tax=uncultured Tyzzerella sp. TaxID=2321398 RepID=UPI00294356FB|nr:class I SAM-dependent methyltransferase [uncultured Tyzzerella sp.]
MELSYRLNKIAQKVTKNGIIADIGTDHAYIPIFLYKNNKIKSGIACDISKGSLQKAKDNIKKYNLQDSIQTRLGNGLEKINLQDRVDTIIIAGMGGMLMIDILQNGKDITENAKELILQPQKDIDKVRKYLHNNNFKIIDDEMLKDDGKYYTIIKAIKGKEDVLYKNEEYIFGKFEIANKCKILKEYIEDQVYKMEIVLRNIKKTNVESRILEIEKNIKMYKEVLKCL